MTIKLREIANPAAVAWEWTSGETRYQIVWTRGLSLQLGINVGGSWVLTNIDSPERFLAAPTLKAARIAADRFVNDPETA